MATYFVILHVTERYLVTLSHGSCCDDLSVIILINTHYVKKVNRIISIIYVTIVKFELNDTKTILSEDRPSASMT